MTRHIIFIGCGKVAIGAAHLLQQKGVNVHGVRRNIASLPDTLHRTAADVSNPASLRFLQSATADTVVYSLAASGFNEESYRAAYITGLRNVIDACNFKQVKRLIFVSSTSVYHQNDDSIVDESSQTNPTRFNGKLMLKAEQLALQTGIGTALRFSGIYGPGRNRLIERVLSGTCTPPGSDTYTNRIHSQDCSAVIAHLALQKELPPVILGTDSLPAKSTQVESYIAAQLNTQKEYEDPTATNKPRVKRIAGSKRCSNQLLLKTGFEFNYPTYKEGYKKLVENYNPND